MKQLMQYSPDGLELTKEFEGLRLEAYQDSASVWTIGYGHVGGVSPGMSITPLRAQALLLNDLVSAEKIVNLYVSPQLSQCEFDALVDFVFNVGSGHFLGSTLLKKLNAGDFTGAAQEFLRWDIAGGVKSAGLLRRRQAELAEFMGKRVSS